MNPIRSTLSALALAAMAVTAAHAQTTTPEPAPTAEPAGIEGQRSTPMQDRGAMAGTAGEEAARQQAMEARMAREAARWGKDGGVQGEMSVPHQDRGGIDGLGEQPSTGAPN